MGSIVKTCPAFITPTALLPADYGQGEYLERKFHLLKDLAFCDVLKTCVNIEIEIQSIITKTPWTFRLTFF